MQNAMQCDAVRCNAIHFTMKTHEYRACRQSLQFSRLAYVLGHFVHIQVILAQLF